MDLEREGEEAPVRAALVVAPVNCRGVNAAGMRAQQARWVAVADGDAGRDGRLIEE